MAIISDTAKKLEELEKSLNELKNPVAQLGKTLDAVVSMADFVGSIARPFTQVQDAAAELAKSVGLSSKSILSTAIRTVEMNSKMQHSMSYNISNTEMLRMQSTMMSKLQRNVSIDQVQRDRNGEIIPIEDSTLENLIAASKVFGEESVGNIVAGFDKLGISMKSAAKATGKLYKEAESYGINLQKYTQNFTSNLDMAQRYNFRNGVNGLKEMARKATEIRQDMKQVASFADKVGSVTGAVEAAANLQVLGGSFAALSNPLAMLNESLTDMNGLQDRFNQMTAGAASYNSVTHQIEMDPVTRMRMKRAAEAMGVDYGNLLDQSFAQARKGEIERQINTNGIGGIDEKLKTLLSNVGEIDSETGVAGATIGGEFRSIAEIAGHPELQQQLIEETQSESEDIKAIAKAVMTIEDKMKGYRSQAENEAARNVLRPGISGQSAYEIASRILNEKFTPDVLTAANNLDAFSKNIESFNALLFGQAVPAGVKAIDATLHSKTPAEAKSAVEKELLGALGDSDLAKEISSLFGSIAAIVQKTAAKVDEYTTSTAGTSSLPGKYGIDTATITGKRSNYVEIEPASSGGAATGTSINSVTQPTQYINTAGNNGTTFVSNQSSIPSTQVVPSSTQGQQTQGVGQNTGQKQEVTWTINLGGNLKMDVNGDDKKSSSVDLIKMLENDQGFKMDLAKLIEETIMKLNAAGMSKNQI